MVPPRFVSVKVIMCSAMVRVSTNHEKGQGGIKEKTGKRNKKTRIE